MKKKPMTKPEPPELMVELAKKLNPSTDVMQIPLQIEKKQAILFYLKTVVDSDKLQNMIIKPFFEVSSLEHFESYMNSLPDKVEIPGTSELLIKITQGFVLISIQDRLLLFDIKKLNSDVVQQTAMEGTVHGPQLALSESLETNLNIIRHHYHNPDLTIEMIQLSDKSNRSIAIVYDSQTVNKKVLNQITNKLKHLKKPLVQSGGDLENFLTDKKYNLLPRTLLTERPDRIVYNIIGGKVVIFVDGSPNGVIAPVVFFDFMTAMEDNYHAYWVSLFGTILGYFGLLTCLLLPSIYVVVTSYAPEILRTELALTVTASRVGVPYPSYIEVLFMLIFMELLTEASIRLPKAISAAATTVGGLILGTAATEAALASTVMIIVVAAVAISTFAIPVNELSFSLRVLRILLLVFTTLFGLSGLIIGFLGILMHLGNMDSFGEPYFRFFQKNKNEEKKVSNG